MKEEEVKKGFICYALFFTFPTALCVSLMLISCGGGSSNPVVPAQTTTAVKAIATGNRHTCALLSTGSVKCWGNNQDGQLGNGTISSSATPTTVINVNSEVIDIAAGMSHTCILTSSGGVKCWGRNSNDQLGAPTTSDPSTIVDVTGLNAGVKDISAGNIHTCALTTLGTPKCWGYNQDGQLGNGTNNSSSTPVDVINLNSEITTIVAGGTHTCTLLTSGSVKCWGRNEYGQLGNGTNANASTPTDVLNLSGVTAITAGYYHTCALLSSGGVKCWGSNQGGILGNGQPDIHSNTPVDVTSLSTGVIGIAAGGVHTCALLSSESVKCWGINYDGELGNGTAEESSTPVDVSSLNNVIAISAGLLHTCALTSSGTVKCWGSNYYGELGSTTATGSETCGFNNACSKTPVDVVGL